LGGIATVIFICKSPLRDREVLILGY